MDHRFRGGQHALPGEWLRRSYLMRRKHSSVREFLGMTALYIHTARVPVFGELWTSRVAGSCRNRDDLFDHLITLAIVWSIMRVMSTMSELHLVGSASFSGAADGSLWK